jgi:hypothetical protein
VQARSRVRSPILDRDALWGTSFAARRHVEVVPEGGRSGAALLAHGARWMLIVVRIGRFAEQLNVHWAAPISFK